MVTIQLISPNQPLKRSLKAKYKSRFQIFTASSTKDGLNKVSNNTIDLLIVEINSSQIKNPGWFKKINKLKNLEKGEMGVLLIPDESAKANNQLTRVFSEEPIQDIFWGSTLDNTGNEVSQELEFFIEKNIEHLQQLRDRFLQKQKAELWFSNINKTWTQDNQENPTDRDSTFFTLLHSQSDDVENLLKQVGFANDTLSPVLISGPEGLEQNELAEYIHSHSKNKQHPLITIDLSKIEPHLQESIIFGSAQSNIPGLKYCNESALEQTGKGTLHIKYLENLSWGLQSRLLKTMWDHYFLRDTQKIQVKCRIIFSMYNNPKKSIDQGVLRQDLHSHLSLYSVKIPLISQRKKDIPLIIDQFARAYEERTGTKITVTESAKFTLTRKRYIGQIEQLLQTLKELFQLANTEINDQLIAEREKISPVKSNKGNDPSPENSPFLRENVSDATQQRSLFNNSTPNWPAVSLAELERNYIIETLQRTFFNISETSRVLGISRKTLYEKIKKYNIPMNKIQKRSAG